MHKLGEQWIETIDGHEHMVKAVAPVFDCQGCMYLAEEGCVNSYLIINCGIGKRFIIKDLGILCDGMIHVPWNSDIYPGKPIKSYSYGGKEFWFIDYKDIVTGQRYYVEGDTEQQAIDAWNRRA